MKILPLLLTMLLSACPGPSPGVNPSPAPTQKVIQVHPAQKDCMGMGPQKCMQVRDKGAQDWTLFYETIQGFSFEPGYQVEMLVEVEVLQNPPADGSAHVYRLIRLISKTPSTEK